MTAEEEKELIIFIMLENRCDFVRAQMILEKFGKKKGGEKDEHTVSD